MVYLNGPFPASFFIFEFSNKIADHGVDFSPNCVTTFAPDIIFLMGGLSQRYRS